MPKYFILIIFSFFSSLLISQTKVSHPFLKYQNDQWVDSVFNSLSIDEKIGQLIMVPAYSSKGNEYMMQLIKMVKENKVGGIIAMQ